MGLRVTRFRPYRNGDSPALVDLWNRGLPDQRVARPLDVHEFDALVMGKLPFEAAGLIVAEHDGRAVGFAHAGFGPLDPLGTTHRLDTTMGAVGMMVLEPGRDDPEAELGLFTEAERYLRRRGAQVFYAGGQYPVNPFYWGLYGGSEWSGVLASHRSFHRAAQRAGYEPASTTVLLEADLAQKENRDPRAPLLRRQIRLEVLEDDLLDHWWDALAIGLFRPTTFRLLDRTDDRILARAVTWDMVGFDRIDGRIRTALIGLEVDPGFRRKGFGRLLVAEILRHARGQSTDLVAVQTSSTNEAALRLYDAMGFFRVETATLYRLPAERAGRSMDPA
jgi:ribosomal protein S18 acetylase RimI-like enzyme